MDALARERGFSAIAYGENADDLGTFKQIGEEAARIAARGSSFLDFPQARKEFYHGWPPQRNIRLSRKRCGKGGSIFTPARHAIVYALGRLVGLPMSDQQLKSLHRARYDGASQRANYRRIMDAVRRGPLMETIAYRCGKKKSCVVNFAGS
jgi:hypothetical protein